MYLAYPWFLTGLVAVAIPIAIHLLQLRRPRRLIFSNNAFIKEIELISVRHRQVKYLLILLTRVFGIIALVLMFCKPFLGLREKGIVNSLSSSTVLIDNSFSMQRRGDAGNSLFEQVRSEVRGMTQSYADESRITLLNVSSQSLIGTGFDKTLNDLRLTTKKPLANIKKWQSQLTRGDASLYIFSDFQKSGFGPKELDLLDPVNEVMLVPFAGVQAGNLYVDSIWVDDAFVRAQTDVELNVRVRNGSTRMVENCPVKVYLNAKQVGSFQTTVAPGAAITSVVQLKVEDSDLATGKIVLDDEPVNFDNTSYFTLQPLGAIRILEIGDIPLTQQLYGNEPLFKYAFAKPRNINFAKLQQANVVIMQGVQDIDEGLRDGLRSVVKRGGSIVIVPSAVASSHVSYQEAFKVLGLGGVQWEATGTAPDLRQVAMPNTRTAFFKDVFGAQQKAVTMPMAAPILRWSRTRTDILRMQDGESYLAEFEQGQGRIYVFSAPFSNAYSDFVGHALFVPVMYRLAMLSYHNEQLPAYRLTQASINLKLPAGMYNAEAGANDAQEASFKLVKDSLIFVPSQRVVGQEVQLGIPVGMEEPGFYQVQRGSKVLTTLAFNQDKRESELASYSADELRALIGPNRPNIHVVENGKGLTLANLRAEQGATPLWRYCLGLALACLLAEALLVRFMLNKNKTAVAQVTLG